MENRYADLSTKTALNKELSKLRAEWRSVEIDFVGNDLMKVAESINYKLQQLNTRYEQVTGARLF